MAKGTERKAGARMRRPGPKPVSILTRSLALCLTGFLFFSTLVFSAGQKPAPKSTVKPVAVKAGWIQTVTKGIIKNGIVLVRGDRIEDIGAELAIPADAEILDFKDRFVMPGIVSPDSILGVPRPSQPETQAAALAMPSAENLANYPILYSIYPENPDYRMALRHGFTTLAIAPFPQGIAGLAAVIRPEGERLAEMLVRDRAFLKILVSTDTPFWNMMKRSLDEAQKKLDDLKKKEEERKKAEAEKKQKKGKKEEEKKTEPADEEETLAETTKVFMDVVEGKLPIMAECRAPSAVDHFTTLISAYPKVKVIVRGGPEIYRAGEVLKEKKIPVILSPAILALASARSLVERTNYVLKCQNLGLKLAFQAAGEVEEQIHLFDALNQLAVYGVDKDILLKGVTIVPAEILGLDKDVGSLEKGKKADLVVFRADPLDNPAVVEAVISGGKLVR